MLFDLFHFLSRYYRVYSFFGCELFVEVGNVEEVSRQLRLEGRFKLFEKQLLDVDAVEERMFQNFIDTLLAAETIYGVFLQQLRYEVFALITHLYLVTLWVREIHWLFLDELIHFEVVVAAGVKRWKTHNHLICEYT